MTDASHPAAVQVGDALYLRDAKGSLVPIEAVKPMDLLMDETVRAIITRAGVVSDQVSAFKRETGFSHEVDEAGAMRAYREAFPRPLAAA